MQNRHIDLLIKRIQSAIKNVEFINKLIKEIERPVNKKGTMKKNE